MSADTITNWIHVAVSCVDFCIHAPRLTAMTEIMRKLERYVILPFYLPLIAMRHTLFPGRGHVVHPRYVC